ncbi:LapD/MoxY N-terminal periplasmic domain-containing protein [Sulfurimonas sp.]|uniref:LapD/MoxY N-terminal periplasmic domain-containing protein n=1 Tax=Sulfurimonas sp. TaxID=2022749 RepID=UPI0035652835
MTLFKQIAMMLSVFLIILLSTVLVLNFQSANDSVQKRLFEDAKNTASSLSLSLGSANGDITMMSTMINANFDSGNYQFISLEDIDGSVLFKREGDIRAIDIPEWFVNLINIKAPVASANVSAGWSPIGILYVQSDVSYAQVQLYSVLKSLLISFIILATIGLVILNLLIHAVLKPLKQVQLQAEAVSRNEFITQTNIPKTKEFKDVVVGMNTMVHKVKVMFDKGNEELKRQKELEYIDPATKLRNRKYLIDKLPEYLKIDASSKGGIHMMIALSGVVEANEKIGHRDVDALFISMADIFKAHANNYFNSIVARMNGTEFSILLPDCESEDGLDLAQGISASVNEAIEDAGLDTAETYISIGLYEYNYTQNTGQLLSLSDNALAKAKFNDSKIHLEHAEDATEVMGKDAWREIIHKAIEDNGFEFLSYKAVDAKTKKDVHNALSISMNSDGKTYYFGQFMAPANQAGLGNDIYKKIMSMMFTQPDMRLKGSTCSLRLPYDFLYPKDTYDHMVELFSKYASNLPFKLIIEMPDKLIAQNSESIKLYKELLEKYGFEMAVFEFIGESSDYKYLQDLRPAYIKGEADYYINQSEQSLSALRLITDSVGIELIATGVMNMDTLKELEKKDIHIIQGRATEALER